VERGWKIGKGDQEGSGGEKRAAILGRPGDKGVTVRKKNNAEERRVLERVQKKGTHAGMMDSNICGGVDCEDGGGLVGGPEKGYQ